MKVLNRSVLVSAVELFQILRVQNNANRSGCRGADHPDTLVRYRISQIADAGSVLLAVDLRKSDLIEDRIPNLDQSTIA